MRDANGKEGYVVESDNSEKKDMNMRDLLKITRTIHEGVDERVAAPMDTSNLKGEELIKANYRNLSSDLEYTKLAQAYENFLKVKRIEFQPSNVIEKALSAARDLIAEYLRGVKGLNVTGEDVQNYFQNTIRNFGRSVMNEDENKETMFDQSMEEEKFRNFFNDMNVNIKFIDLEVFDNLVFWGGTINGIIQFVYKVTPGESSPPEFNYLEDFSPDNPENDEIIGRVESYFDNFYKFWESNVLEPNTEPAAEEDNPEDSMSYEKGDAQTAEPKTIQMTPNPEEEEDELQQAAE
jgi:hypothetical protein